MILGVGTDIVHIARFDRWQQYQERSLLKIFSPLELAQARSTAGQWDIKKLAVAFALKEAFYKALSASLIQLGLTRQTFSFLQAARNIVISRHDWGVPQIAPDWAVIEGLVGQSLPPLAIHCSVSHESDMVVAFVVIN